MRTRQLVSAPLSVKDTPAQLKMDEEFEGLSMAAPDFGLQVGAAAPPPEDGEASDAPESFAMSENRTGLPDDLKSGVEQLSGYSLDDVRVKFNSEEPAQLNANAFARGNEIHVGAGQEQHLPEEAWHVAQQKAGRVQANAEVNGQALNDEAGLESEARSMGAKAAQLKGDGATDDLQSGAASVGVVQRAIEQDGDEDNVFNDPEDETVPDLYFSKKYIAKTDPIFVNADFVDALVSLCKDLTNWELDGVTDAIGAYFTKQKPVIGGRKGMPEDYEDDVLSLFQQYQEQTFWRDREGETRNITSWISKNADKYFLSDAIRTAMSHPALGGRGGGFSNRFPDGRGTLISKLPLEKVAAALGLKEEAFGANSELTLVDPSEVDPTVLSTFLSQETPELNFVPEGESESIVYFRRSIPGNLVGKEEVTPRKGKSKFMGAKVNAATFEDFRAKLGDPNAISASDLPEVPGSLGSGGWVDYRGKARRKGRGKGQFANMNKWNALGYAAYAVMMGVLSESALSTDWEWLHIRGAGLGGPTDASNLLAGTSSANSAMIPWEDKIKEFSGKVDRSRNETFSVKYEGFAEGMPNLGGLIRISVAAPEGIAKAGIEPISKDSPIVGNFDPRGIGVFDDISRHFSLNQEVVRRPEQALVPMHQSQGLPSYIFSLLSPEELEYFMRTMMGNPLMDRSLFGGENREQMGGGFSPGGGFNAGGSPQGFNFGGGNLFGGGFVPMGGPVHLDLGGGMMGMGQGGRRLGHSGGGKVRRERRRYSPYDPIGFGRPGRDGHRKALPPVDEKARRLMSLKERLIRNVRNLVNSGTLNEEQRQMGPQILTQLRDGTRDRQLEEILLISDRPISELVGLILDNYLLFYWQSPGLVVKVI